MRVKARIALAGLIVSAVSWAEEAAPAKVALKPAYSVDVWQWLLALLLVLGLLAALVWLLKKGGHPGLNNKGELSIVTGLSLGVRERVVLLNVGDKQLLLGVTPGRIDKLMELEGNDRLFQGPVAGTEAGGFSEKLMQALQGKHYG